MAGPTAVQTEVESMIKSCIVSCKDVMTMKTLNDQYYEIIGEKIPHQKFGFNSLHHFLGTIPGITLTKVQGDVIVGATSEKASHIASLVSRQRGKTSKGKKFHGLLVAPTGWRSKGNKILYRSPCKDKKPQNPQPNRKNDSIRSGNGRPSSYYQRNESGGGRRRHSSKPPLLPTPAASLAPKSSSFEGRPTASNATCTRSAAATRGRLSFAASSPVKATQGEESEDDESLNESLVRYVKYSPTRKRLEVTLLPEPSCSCRPGVQCSACTKWEERRPDRRVQCSGGKLQVEVPLRMCQALQSKANPQSASGSARPKAFCLKPKGDDRLYSSRGQAGSADDDEWEDGPFLLDHQLVGDDFLLQFANKSLNADCSWLRGERLACGTCISGQTIRQCLRMFSQAPVICPNLVLMLGAADVMHGYLLSRMCDDLWELVGTLLPVTESLVLLTLPFFPHPNTGLNQTVMAFNHFIKSLSTMTKVHVLDTHPLFSYNSLPDKTCFEKVVRPITCYPRGVVLWSSTGRQFLYKFLYNALYEVSRSQFW